jgi:hypothetical protein
MVGVTVVVFVGVLVGVTLGVGKNLYEKLL